MRHNKIFFLIIFSFLLFSLKDASADPLKEMADSLFQTIKEKPNKTIAILDFLYKNEFISSGTEIVNEKLNEYICANEGVHLINKHLLNKTFEKMKFNKTGLLDVNTLKELKRILGIIAIITGELKDIDKQTTQVKARIQDTSTGDILFERTTNIPRTWADEPVPSMVLDTKESKDSLKKKQELFAQKKKEIEDLLKDVHTQEKINSIIENAMMIPFDLESGSIHLEILRYFNKYRVENNDYNWYLAKELAKVQYPDNDQRAIRVIEYFGIDNIITQNEWDAGLKIIKNTNKDTISSYLKILFNTKVGTYNEETLKHIDEFFGLVQDGMIGFPDTISFYDAFCKVLEIFNYRYNTNNWVFLHTYEKYSKYIELNKESITLINELLQSMYFRERYYNNKQKILGWIIEFFLVRESDSVLTEDIFDFLIRLEDESNKGINSQKLREVLKNDLLRVIAEIKDKVCESLAYTTNSLKLKECIDFCLDNNIQCPDIIPKPQDAVELLLTLEWDKRARGAEMLSKMNEKAFVAENVLVEKYKEATEEKGYQITRFKRFAVTIFGNIKTNNPQSMELLVQSLNSEDDMLVKYAMSSIVKIGEPIVPYLILNLKSDSKEPVLNTIKVITLMKNKAYNAIIDLKQLAHSKDKDIAIAAHQAVKILEEK